MKPIHVTDSDFEQQVLQSDKPVLVDFWAPWCGPCRTMGPVLDELASEFENRLVVAKINVDDHQHQAGQYGVQGIPCLVFFNNGVEVKRQVGSLPLPSARKIVEEVLASTEGCCGGKSCGPTGCCGGKCDCK